MPAFEIREQVESTREVRVLQYPVTLALAILGACMLWTSALAQDAEALTKALRKVLEMSSFVEANLRFCQEKAPDSTPTVSEAVVAWRTANEMGAIDRLKSAVPDGEKVFGKLEHLLIEKRAEQITSRVRSARNARTWCAEFPKALRGEKMELRKQLSEEMAVIDRIDAKLSRSGKTGTPDKRSTNRQSSRRKEAVKSSAPKKALSPMPAFSYAAMVESGVDPERIVLRDEFRCYGRRESDDYASPDMAVQFVDERRYRSSFGDGRYVMDSEDSKVVFKSGPLEGVGSTSVKFTDYGQQFTLLRVKLGGPRKYVCYQRGAAEQHALVRFRLAEPQPGDYDCRDTAGTVLGKLTLGRGGRYSINARHGRYSVDLRSSRAPRSKIEWQSGPFQGQRARFEEESGTGFRSLTLKISDVKLVANAFTGGVVSGGSSTMSATCTGVGEPVALPRFGADPAPEPPEGTGGFSGFFAVRDTAGSATGKSASNYRFYTFFDNGYVYLDEPDADPADVDCSRTKPNGAPVCAIYSVRVRLLAGKTITIASDEPVPLELSGDELALGKHGGFRVAPAKDKLKGRFWANAGSTVGVCGPFGACSSWYEEREFTFRHDGTFDSATKGQSTSSLNTAIGSSYGGGKSNDANAGRYRITGNVIELRYDDGRVVREFIMTPEPTRVHIGGWSYAPKEDD